MTVADTHSKFAGRWRWSRTTVILIALATVVVPVSTVGQTRQAAPSGALGEYDERFFEQLRSLFGRFRDADLQRAFETAKPVSCSELVADRGEWKEVAFFNENRKLGDWYRANIDEVRQDLGAFVFKGPCNNDRWPAQLTTRFPVAESIDAYNDGRINLRQIAVNTNTAVSAFYDMRTQAYTFNLPYLFLVEREGDNRIYSLFPQSIGERYNYDPEVINRWDCKAVRGREVTYQFLICRSTMVNRDNPRAGRERPAFGSSAYSILSDGKEASATVKFSFGDDVEPEQVPPAPAALESITPQRGTWQQPDVRLALADAGQSDFRIKFNPEVWTGRVGVAHVLSDQGLTRLESSKPREGSDYCIWLPVAGPLLDRLLTSAPETDIAFSIKPPVRDRFAATSIVFDMRSRQGTPVGSLQCYFPRAGTADTIGFDRWMLTVGSYLMLEIQP